MALPATSVSFPHFPAEMLAAVKAEAARDADLVGVFLYGFGIRGTPDKPVALPRRFLISRERSPGKGPSPGYGDGRVITQPRKSGKDNHRPTAGSEKAAGGASARTHAERKG
jgi:hypothetical protein